MITRFATLTSRLAVSLALLFAIAACGGGGGGGGGGGFLGDAGGGDTDTYFLQTVLKDPNGDPTNTVSATAPGSLQVLVTRNSRNGKPVANVIVRASTDSGLLFPASGSKLTNADGAATFRIEAGEGRGAGVIVVEVDNESGGIVSQSINFQIGQIGLRLGRLLDGQFIEGAIGIEPAGPISSRGQAVLSLAIVDENGALVRSAESVRINSDCLQNGDATLAPVSPIATSSGQITATYDPRGCQGTDTLTAELVGEVASAVGDIEINPPAAGSLNFVGAEPQLIVLQGTGGGPDRVESSDVTFQAIDSGNNPIQGVEIRFSLTTDVGGITLSPSSAVTDADGNVVTTVSSGDVATVVRVIAAATDRNGNETSAISDILTVSTGLPDQDSVSVSVSDTFVVEKGMTTDGIARSITVRMADKFNNPVPDGTAAVFTTEYGSIDPSCETGRRNGDREGGTPGPGECTVKWISQAPRVPTLDDNQELVRTIWDAGYSCPGHNGANGPCPNDLGMVRGGRSTILVTAIGEESFIDRNGNGIFDRAEAENSPPLFTNLTEAFIDKNENGLADPFTSACINNSSTLTCMAGSEETYVDFNSNGVFDANGDDPGNGYPNEGVQAVYNGLLCPPEGDGVWCSRELLNVYGSAVLILSTDDFHIRVYNGRSPVSSTVYGTSYTAYIADDFNSKPPGGSDISITATGDCTVESVNPTTAPNTTAPGALAVTFTQDGEGENAGEVTITVTPNGGTPASFSLPCTPRPPPVEEEGE